MSERVEAQAKTSSTPITTQTQPQLQQRSFSAEVTPAPTEQTEQQPDLQTQLERAERFGHNFANIPIFAPDTQPPPPVQPKLFISQPGDDSDQEAVQLMRIPNLATQPSIQRQLSEESKSPLADYMRRVAQAEQPQQSIQRKSLLQRSVQSAGSNEASSEIESQLAKKTPITLPDAVIQHSNVGDFPAPGNPKKSTVPSTMLGGGHGQANIEYLQHIGFDYNIVQKFSNGVRLGNIPNHKNSLKRTGTGQSWFPESWTKTDIKNAGEYVVNNTPNFDTIPDGQPVYGEYKGVRVGVIKTGGKPATVFPDGTKQP